MCKRNILTIVALAILVLAVGQVQAETVNVPNGTFHMYKPGTNYTVIAPYPGDGYCNGGFGENIPWLNATITYGDGTSGTTVDIPGWITPLESQGSPTQTAQLFSIGYDETDGSSCLNCFGAWSGQNGNLAESADSLGNLAAGSNYTLSAMVIGDAAPVTFELRAGGVAIPPSSSVTPAAPSDWEVISRTYQAGDLVAYVGQPLTIVVGTSRPGPGDPDLTGTRGRFDNISLSYEPLFPASGPIPADEATDVVRDVVLDWNPGVTAVNRDVYFGETFDDVNSATTGTAPHQGNQVETTFDPGRLKFGQTYFWRIDEVNAPPDSTIFTGDVWSFTVELIAYPIENVTATASSSIEGEGAENTVNGSGLDPNDLHSTDPEAMWISEAGDPGSASIQYEFDKPYKLHEMLVWNYNGGSILTMYGLKEVTIEYSTDGTNFSQLENVPEFVQATGGQGYPANTTVAFNGAAAKYVKIIANNNWGGGAGFFNQYGLSEVRFFGIPVYATKPYPDPGATDVDLDVVLGWKAGREAASHDVYVSADPNALTLAGPATEPVFDTASLDLALSQTYHWRVDEVNDAETPTTWQGDIWNFSTPEYLVVDDFESYNDLNPDDPDSKRIFLTWIGGDDDPDNGSQVGHDLYPFAELTTVNSGKQSMPLYYNNTNATNSEAAVDIDDLAIDRDWTKHGIKALTLRFYGDTNNSVEKMYVKIGGVKVPYDGIAENLTRMGWQMWYIDLASNGVNPGNVTELTIGFEPIGAVGGYGVVLIDDIRLYSHDRQLIEPVDPGAESLVAAWNFDEGNGTVATDSSGSGLNGTIVDAAWETGIQGSALLFNGVSSYVNIDGFKGITAVDGVQQAFTISNWIKTTTDGEMVTWGLQGAATRLSWRVESGILRTEHAAGNLRSDTPVNDDEWHHVALVVTEGASLRVPATQFYLDGLPDTTNSGSDTPYNLTPDSDVRIGMSGPQGGRFFTGLIDEVQLYDRALTGGELLWLAGGTQPYDKPF
jgi:hypothetical protein